jgi:hypothetical protein
MENRRQSRSRLGSWYQWEEGGYKKSVMEGEYIGNIIYSWIKMKQ